LVLATIEWQRQSVNHPQYHNLQNFNMSLTPGAVSRLYANDLSDPNPIVQILQIKRISAQGNAGSHYYYYYYLIDSIRRNLIATGNQY
jgi:hypothetical protein